MKVHDYAATRSETSKMNLKHFQLPIVTRIACSLAFLCSLSFSNAAETSQLDYRLVGIVDCPGLKCTALEIRSASPPYAILSEGEGELDLEVISIQPAARTVQVRRGGKQLNLTLNLTDSGSGVGRTNSGLTLDGASLDVVLLLYQKLAQRTVLRHPGVPAMGFTLNANAATQAEGARALEQALQGRDLAVIADGPAFTMVVPNELAANAKPNGPSRSGTDTDLLPRGFIIFYGVDLYQAAIIYAELVGRKLDRQQTLMQERGGIWLHTETSMTKAESLYALETMFRWRGWKFESSGTNILKAVKFQP